MGRRSRRAMPSARCEIVEARPPASLAGMLGESVQCWRMGELWIIQTRNGGHSTHLSISHPRRLPTWEEVRRVRYELLPLDATFAMLLPPPEDYVNVHEFCFQLIEVQGDVNAGVRVA